jgi:DNA-binding protein HU-beta
MKEKMTFTDLVEKIASETGATKTLVHDLITEAIALNRDGLENDGNNNIPSFGRFSLKWHKSRKGRNPQSGETIDIPAHSSVNFKALASLRNHINRKYAHLKPELIKMETIDVKDDLKETPAKEEKVPPVVTKTPINEDKAPKTVVDIHHKEEPKKEFVQPKTAAKTAPEPAEEKKTGKAWWLWLLVLLLIIFLIYLFWPTSDSADIVDEQTTETSTISNIEEADVQAPIPEVKTDIETKAPIAIEKAEVTPTEKIITGIPSSKHKIKSDEYFYSISKDYYKNASFWPIIYKENRNNIRNPDILVIGREITLPALQGLAENLSEQDTKNIAKGYMEVYLFYKDTNRKKALYHLWVAKKLNIAVIEEYADQINSEDLDSINNFTGEIKF